MRLIIAEKHSVGQAIAQAVGGHMEKHDGYVQVGDDLVTWAQGHLVDLAAPDEYKDHDWDRWSLDTLPIDPTPDWQWKVSRDKGRGPPVQGRRGTDAPRRRRHACRRMRSRP
jgi:DNA topoisomerase-3